MRLSAAMFVMTTTRYQKRCKCQTADTGYAENALKCMYKQMWLKAKIRHLRRSVQTLSAKISFQRRFLKRH